MSFCRYHTCKDKQFLLIQQEKHDIYIVQLEIISVLRHKIHTNYDQNYNLYCLSQMGSWNL